MFDCLPVDIHPVATMLPFSDISNRPDTGAMLTSKDTTPTKQTINNQNQIQ